MERHAASTIVPINATWRVMVRRNNIGGWCVWEQRYSGRRWRNVWWEGSYEAREDAEAHAEKVAQEDH